MPHEPRRHRPVFSTRLPLAICAAFIALWLAACASPVPPAQLPASPNTPPIDQTAVTAEQPLTDHGQQDIISAPAAPEVSEEEQDLLPWALAYAEHLRQLTPPAVQAEIASIGEPGGHVRHQMQMALALLQLSSPGDTGRALGLLQRVINQSGPQAESLRPLARLLATRLQAQRRLEDSTDRLGQQLREAQRRNELLSDQLNAMRAIERSLSPRPASPAGR